MKIYNFVLGALICCASMAFSAEMRYLYSTEESIPCRYDSEILSHPYLGSGKKVAEVKGGESLHPLPAGSYLIHEKIAPGKIRTRYLAVATEGWTVVQCTVGSTGDKLDSVFHPVRVPVVYYAGIGEIQKDTTLRGFQIDYGDDVYLHLHPDTLSEIEPSFKTLKANWEAFTVPEIVDRLRFLDKWMQGAGFKPLNGFASYTPANSLVQAMREVKWNVLHSIIPEQNWSDGNWAINHWGMPNQPFYIASDDFRKATSRSAEKGGDVIGMGMNSYHLYMPHVVMWGDNVCSPSHFLRWHRTVDSGAVPLRFRNFLNDYLHAAEGTKDGPFFLFVGFEFGRTFGTRSMTQHNRAGAQYLIDCARNPKNKIVFSTATDVAAWYEKFNKTANETVFTQRDYLAGTRIMDKPINSGPSIGMEMKDYKACFNHLSNLPFYHYDYTIEWKFKAADVNAPHDFAKEDARKVKVSESSDSEGDRKVTVEVTEASPRPIPVCLWDSALLSPVKWRTFVPPVLDDGRKHVCIEIPANFIGKKTFIIRKVSSPDKAEFKGIVSPLWRVQTIGKGCDKQCYAYIDTPLLAPCKVSIKLGHNCEIDSLEAPMGSFKAGETVTLEFDTRRTWFRFRGCNALDIQPDVQSVKAIEKAHADWREFSENAKTELEKIHASSDKFFKSIIPANERLVLDVDCFGNSVFGERSRAKPFDRTVFAANKTISARELSDGGISFGKGRSFWVHPRGLHFNIEGIDSLKLKPNSKLRVRLSTVAGKNETLNYKITISSGWTKIAGDKKTGQTPLKWKCSEKLSPESIFTYDIPVKDISDGQVSFILKADQQAILDDWFAQKGFIARLERLVVTVVE